MRKNLRNRKTGQIAAETEEIKVKNAFSLSVNLTKKGHLLKADSFSLASELVDYIIENIDRQLIHKKIENSFKKHCIHQLWLETERAMALAKMTYDQVDPGYDYSDECTEPVPNTVDSAAGGDITLKNPLLGLEASQLNQI